MQRDASFSSEIGELDLRKSMMLLWRWRVLIISITLIFGIFSGLIASLIKPAYEAKSFVRLPSNSEIAIVNAGRTADYNLKTFTAVDVFNIYNKSLQAHVLRREIFDKNYFPLLSDTERDQSPEVLFNDFSKRLVITPGADRSAVMLRDGVAERAAATVTAYTERAGDLAKIELKKTMEGEITTLLNDLNRQIIFQREVALRKRQDTVVKLKEALAVAREIGLQQPLVTKGSPIVDTHDSQTVYMRGAKAIQAEIENLESRVSDDPFIDSLRGIQIKQDYYSGYKPDLVSLKVYELDGNIGVSAVPVARRKLMIVLLGLVLGLTVGLVSAICIDSFRVSKVTE